MTSDDKKRYIEQVKKDFAQLKEMYPFSTLSIAPTTEITPVTIKVTAANKKLIDAMLAEQSDFQGEYSRDLHLVVPFEYQQIGCEVYGGRWIKTGQVKNSDLHFHGKSEDGSLKFCVGVPESFKVLIKELQSLCLDVNVLSEEDEELEVKESTDIDDEVDGNFELNLISDEREVQESHVIEDMEDEDDEDLIEEDIDYDVEEVDDNLNFDFNGFGDEDNSDFEI